MIKQHLQAFIIYIGLGVGLSCTPLKEKGGFAESSTSVFALPSTSPNETTTEKEPEENTPQTTSSKGPEDLNEEIEEKGPAPITRPLF